MRLFGPLYDRVLSWARHPHAPWYLGGLSFAESSFFPIPPDVMLAPMTLARPEAAMRLALLTTLTSVAGGIAGYAIGYFAIDLAEPWMREAGYWDGYTQVRVMFVPAFVAASFLGRGARFFLVASLIRAGGPAMERRLRTHVEILGWAFVVILVIAYLLLKE
jgi:membrane protein YqaA with SNARE-associated domain